MATHSSILAWRIPWTEQMYLKEIMTFLNPFLTQIYSQIP